MKKQLLTTVTSLCVYFTASSALAEKWVVTTLEWPPFTCEKCPDQGAGAKALREAMKSVGVEVEFRFLPWSRAIKEAGSANIIGYYPSWPEDIVSGFHGSEVVFQSPVGFIEPKAKPLNWNSLDDLKGKTIGIVQDYGNTPDFNAKAKAGVFKTDTVVSDDINVKKVAAEKLDGAIIDLNNAKWFLQTDLKSLAPKVTVNSKVLENKNLLVAFNTANKDKNAKLAEALKKVNTKKIVDDYLATHLK